MPLKRTSAALSAVLLCKAYSLTATLAPATADSTTLPGGKFSAVCVCISPLANHLVNTQPLENKTKQNNYRKLIQGATKTLQFCANKVVVGVEMGVCAKSKWYYSSIIGTGEQKRSSLHARRCCIVNQNYIICVDVYTTATAQRTCCVPFSVQKHPCITFVRTLTKTPAVLCLLFPSDGGAWCRSDTGE